MDGGHSGWMGGDHIWWMRAAVDGWGHSGWMGHIGWMGTTADGWGHAGWMGTTYNG